MAQNAFEFSPTSRGDVKQKDDAIRRSALAPFPAEKPDEKAASISAGALPCCRMCFIDGRGTP